jgi:hypothetical protein
VSVPDDDLRERVLREIREEVSSLARGGMSATEIDQAVNGHRKLTEDEQDLVYLLTYHSVVEFQGRYWQ